MIRCRTEDFVTNESVSTLIITLKTRRHAFTFATAIVLHGDVIIATRSLQTSNQIVRLVTSIVVVA